MGINDLIGVIAIVGVIAYGCWVAARGPFDKNGNRLDVHKH